MNRFNQWFFSAAVLVSCWQGMLTLHELGHVSAALASGGGVTQVALLPFAISWTAISPNPFPGWVVWAGPIVGCMIPVLIASAVPFHQSMTWRLAWFFAGFCLIANGGYIGLGAIGQVGDCGEMLRSGSSMWMLHMFGAMSVSGGFYAWHRVGSIGEFLKSPEQVTLPMTCLAIGLMLLILTFGFWVSQF